VERLELERLDPPAVADVVRDMLGMDEAPGLLVRLVLRHTEGNPLFVAEYLRLAVDEGLLRHEPSGDWAVTTEAGLLASWEGLDSWKLPASLHELISRRLSGLPQEARAVAELAAVFGRQAPAGWLEPASGLATEAWVDALAELNRRQLLEETPQGSLQFTHDKLREVLYRRIPVRRRRKLHRAAAQWIERHDARQQAALGRHWQEAGEPDKARPLYLAAARDAALRHAQAEAPGLFRAYLALVSEPGAESVAARSELAQLVSRQGRMEEAASLFEQALAEAEGLGEPSLAGRVLCRLGANHRIRGSLAQAQRCCRRALRCARQARNSGLQVLALLEQASVCRERWLEGQMARCLDKAIRLARQADDPVLVARALSAQAVAVSDLGRLETARALYEEAIGVLRRLGQPHSLAIALSNLAVNAIYEGRPSEALGLCEEALAIQRRIGDRVHEGMTLGNLGSLRHQLGELDLAWKTYEAALAVLREVGDAWVEGGVLGDQAELSAEMGRVEQALELFGRAVRAHRRSGNLYQEAEVLRAWAALHRRLGRSLDAVERRLRKAERLAIEAGHGLERIRCQCERGHVVLARGKDARRWLARARAGAARLGGANEASLVGRSLARLEAASRAAARGGGPELFRGELAAHLPRGLRDWLAEVGALAPGADADVGTGPQA
jgi:tetratricopeptide (TPR) repeat protein